MVPLPYGGITGPLSVRYEKRVARHFGYDSLQGAGEGHPVP
jgi:hypothetical protein